ncbi:MAG: flavodoxin, partial [Lachnospiraceae bacterium]|nr:flavodoxin [Lachnospiraceae bacterium]
IKWTNPLSRCNKEQMGGKEVPVRGTIEDFDKYDTIYIGFPIWYGQAPRVIHTFAKGYDWTGKTVHLFATSGGSGVGKTAKKLAPSLTGANIVDAKVVSDASGI